MGRIWELPGGMLTTKTRGHEGIGVEDVRAPLINADETLIEESF
jgi:hypothetical protein